MFERLPTPWGLVRLGVAPDHPNIKAVSRVFEKIAKRPGFRFFGNVEVGRDVSRDDLHAHYHAVVWSVGAQADRRMGIPGEDLEGSMAATAFVAWYNGHPDYVDLAIDLDVERIVVVGNGNVALDCARMLALTREELEATDTVDAAIDAIAASRVSEIVVLGRRGPAQASFTTPELQELGELVGADVAIDPADLELDPASAERLQRRPHADPAPQRRRPARARGEAARGQAATRAPALPRLAARAPRRRARRGGRRRPEPPRAASGRQRSPPSPTGETEVLECGLVLRSVGYRGTPLHGVPFDDAVP